MTDSFTSSHIATATTAATNQLSHKPTVAADPFGMLLCVVNVGWTDAEEKKKKQQQKKANLSPLNGKDWPQKQTRYTSA